MAESSNSTLLEGVSEIAARAGEAILRVYETDFAVEHKGDESPLTAADLAANKVITDGLKRLEPGTPILSEEAAKLPFEERRRWSRYWLVDPLDGTREFIKRNGEFTVNIALIENTYPTLGVVFVPVTGVCYGAAVGEGSTKIDAAGNRESLKVRRLSGDTISAVGSRSHSNERTAAFMQRLGNVKVVSIGSSLKICLVAEGAADVYPRFGPTSEWDTAAAHCVVEQAGGHLTNLDLERLNYNTKDSLLNPFFLVFGDADHDWKQYID